MALKVSKEVVLRKLQLKSSGILWLVRPHTVRSCGNLVVTWAYSGRISAWSRKRQTSHPTSEYLRNLSELVKFWEIIAIVAFIVKWAVARNINSQHAGTYKAIKARGFLREAVIILSQAKEKVEEYSFPRRTTSNTNGIRTLSVAPILSRPRSLPR